MRKRIVLISAAVALLLAGGAVTTSAAAAENPASPGWSRLWWPSLFGIDSSPHSDPRGADRVLEAPFADRGAPERPMLDDADHRFRQRNDHADRLQRNDHADRRQRNDHADRRQHQAPADRRQHRSRSVPQHADRAEHPRTARRPGAVQRPRTAQLPPQVAARRQPVQQPQQQRPQRAATDVLAGARQAVTSRDVSAGVHSPVQQKVLALINQNRRRGGCAPFRLDRRLIEAANVHASDMARRRYFDHESPRGQSAGDRVKGAGYRWQRYGENIARGADSPWEVVNGWMKSPPHRRNIMDCRLREMGVGLAISRDRTPYWVQDFATPRS